MMSEEDGNLKQDNEKQFFRLWKKLNHLLELQEEIERVQHIAGQMKRVQYISGHWHFQEEIERLRLYGGVERRDHLCIDGKKILDLVCDH